MWNMRSVTVLAAAMLAAGCEEVLEPASCQEDFDCPAGQVCRDATAASPGTCQDVPAGTTRTFGEVTLDFQTGAETYLLSVFALPRAAEAPDVEAPFELTTAADVASLRYVQPLVLDRVDPAWEARLAYEARRRARVDGIVADLRAGRRLEPQSPARATAACGDCGSTQMCWQGACTSQPVIRLGRGGPQLTGDLVAVVDAGSFDVNVVVHDATPTAAAEAEDAAQSFASTLPAELGFFGLAAHTGSLDRDGDGRLTVVFTNEEVGRLTTDIVGFFDPGDFLPATDADATGNAADLLWSRLPGAVNIGGEITEELAVGTLVHEYVHLLSYAVRVHERGNQALREALWLDEGLAHLAEDLTGWGGSNIGAVAEALASWNSATFASGNDSVAQRGKAFLLLRHLLDSAPQSSTEILRTLLHEAEAGFDHGIFQDDGAEKVWRWQVGTYATGNTAVTVSAAHAYDYDPVGTSAATGKAVGVDMHRTYIDARGETLDLDGPEVELVDDATTAPSLRDGSVPISGTMLFVVTGSEGRVTLRGTTRSELDLYVRAIQVQ